MKLLHNNLDLWVDAHVFYGMYEHNIGNHKGKAVQEEFKWRRQFLEKATHGGLLLKNSLFKDLSNSKKVYLAHVTPNFHNIQIDHVLYPSAGCLVGSVYCTPVSKEGSKLRVHNLGNFIYQKEMPLFSKFIDVGRRAPLAALLIEVSLPEASKDNLVGIDYLRLGSIHFNIYKELEYLLSPKERYDLEELCVKRVKRAFKYLCLCNRTFISESLDKSKIGHHEFMELFLKTIDHLPILGYFYFEVLAEYIMLFQDNVFAKDYAELGEFYSPTYKELVFYLCPKLSKDFSLREFKPTLANVVKYMRDNEVFKNLDQDHLFSYLTRRLIFLTNARLFCSGNNFIDWEKLRWDFGYLSKYMQPLLGHLIHRELRTFGRYPHFYFYFDQSKALQVWNYWNHMDIAIPFNGIIPKGEVGINPAHPNLKYKVYAARPRMESGKMYIEPGKNLDIEIVPKLIDPKFASMRNKGTLSYYA